jgi:hypothetical protein
VDTQIRADAGMATSAALFPRKLRPAPIAAGSTVAGGILETADSFVVAIVIARSLSAGSRNFPQEVGLPDIFHL